MKTFGDFINTISSLAQKDPSILKRKLPYDFPGIQQCGFCPTIRIDNERMDRCALCGKFMCGEETCRCPFPLDESCEDGALCNDCAKHYEIDDRDGVGVRERKTRKHVNAPYL